MAIRSPMPARPEKVAMPLATVTAEPPLSVPPVGLVPMARLTLVVLSAVSMLPLPASWLPRRSEK